MRLPQSPKTALALGMVIGVCMGTPVAYVTWRAEHPPRGKTHYRLMVSPTFTPEQQEEIRRAAIKWEKAVHDPRALTISVQVGACPAEDNVVEGCLLPASRMFHCGDIQSAVGCTTGGYGWRYSRVDIDVTCQGALSHLTQHEIGHVLGLYDTDQKNTVMYRYADCSEIQSAASQDVSQTDVQEYLKMH